MKIVRLFAAVAAVIVMLMCVPLGAFAASGAHFTLTEVEGDGSTVTLGGQKWFRVMNFDDDKDYIITVKDGGTEKVLTVADNEKNSCIWHYYRQTMVASTTPRFTSLTSGGYYLVFSGDKLRTAYTRSVSGDLVWEHVGSALRYNEGGRFSYLRYDAGSDEPLSATAELSDAAEVNIYTSGEQLERCIVSQPHAESYVIEGSGYPAPVFTVGLADVATDSVSWYVDGEKQDCDELSFTADKLTGRSAGVHRVSCIVEAHDGGGIRYRERSEDAVFVIAKGVVPDSVITFSDVHEEYTRIGDAIACVIERTGGYIPSLVICTGDFVNGPKTEADAMLGRYYPRIVAELGGLDAVFVSGNHDSGEAASAMSAAAGLGAGENPPAGGLIFNGKSAKNGKNSRFAKGVIVYGLNQEAVMVGKEVSTAYTYENVLGDIEDFLSKTAADYRGELVIISAHTGLHTLGVQPDSVNKNGYQLSSWIGENQYNIDQSYELAALINRYAEQYGMDIMYLFGHDHSRSETELIMTDGDELISTESYADLSTGSQPLRFTYAHSGYLSTEIGCADSSFSFICRDGGSFAYDLIRTYDSRTRHNDIAARYVPAETTAATSAMTTSVTATAAVTSAKTENPETGDDMSVVLIMLPALILLFSSRRKK